eukprot:14825616-Alexandrium_andersonii.AAC.1
MLIAGLSLLRSCWRCAAAHNSELGNRLRLKVLRAACRAFHAGLPKPCAPLSSLVASPPRL